MSVQRKGITMYMLFCLQGLLYGGNNTLFESTGLYKKVICVLVIDFVHMLMYMHMFVFLSRS
jgi:hypothetical protein